MAPCTTILEVSPRCNTERRANVLIPLGWFHVHNHEKGDSLAVVPQCLKGKISVRNYCSCQIWNLRNSGCMKFTNKIPAWMKWGIQMKWFNNTSKIQHLEFSNKHRTWIAEIPVKKKGFHTFIRGLNWGYLPPITSRALGHVFISWFSPFVHKPKPTQLSFSVLQSTKGNLNFWGSHKKLRGISHGWWTFLKALYASKLIWLRWIIEVYIFNLRFDIENWAIEDVCVNFSDWKNLMVDAFFFP